MEQHRRGCLQPSCLFIILLTLWIQGAGSLRDVELQVPLAVPPGGTATLFCKYDLEGDLLYMVKWYKGRQEFYRYVPKELPHSKVFPISGVNVDISASGANRVVLRNIEPENSGIYRCEVSTDAPNFETMVVPARMNVIAPLMSPPTILLEKGSYSVGDTIRGNCSSPPSTHPANITWFINGRMINSSFVVRHGNITARVTTAELSLDVNTFMGGKLILTCIANTYNVYSSRKDVFLTEDKPRLASVLSTSGASTGVSMFQQLLLSTLLILSKR